MNSLGADLPTKSQTCSKALAAHDTKIKSPIKIAPMGSANHSTLDPIIDMAKPKEFTTMSFRWSI
jgi:hypothetical protein